MNRSIKILLVDDDEEDYLITKDILSDIPDRQYKLSWAQTYAEAMELISKREHDVYLVDYHLGKDTGLDIIQSATANKNETPFILLTGQSDIALDEKAMKAGAADYLVKGSITPVQLDRAIRYSIQQTKTLIEVRKINEELEKRVEIRTRELEMALSKEKDLNDMKSRFVSMASHEFRTPLSTILSSVSLIARYNAPEETEKRVKHIQRIKSAVSNLTDILNDLLSISKLEEGKVTTAPVSFQIGSFLESIVSEMLPVVKKDQVITFLHLDNNNDTTVILDKQLVKNICLNLLSNAIKYSPEQTEILLTLNCSDTNIIIEIRDQGMGIPDNDQQHLFDRFFRAKNALNIQGTGLGLSIVKKYVELLHGDISFKSALEKGTTFTVTLPVAIAANAQHVQV